jgi:serine/threonine protein kinase
MHREGVLHRDLTLENIMLTLTGEVKLVNTQLLCLVSCSAVEFTAYTSFERTTGVSYDGRDDVWAVGYILLELLSRARIVKHTYRNTYCLLLIPGGVQAAKSALPPRGRSPAPVGLAERRCRRLPLPRGRDPAAPAAAPAGAPLYRADACGCAEPTIASTDSSLCTALPTGLDCVHSPPQIRLNSGNREGNGAEEKEEERVSELPAADIGKGEGGANHDPGQQERCGIC